MPNMDNLIYKSSEIKILNKRLIDFELLLYKTQILLMGDAQHGTISIEKLINFNKLSKNTFKIHSIFLESIPYNNGINYHPMNLLQKNITLDLLKKHGIEKNKVKYWLLPLSNICENIYGLEDDTTTKTEYNSRCSKCVNSWNKIIIKHSKIGLNIACVGTAHLVKLQEIVDNKQVIVPSLETVIRKNLKLSKNDKRIKSIAVVDAEDPKINSIGHYKPINTIGTVPFINNTFYNDNLLNSNTLNSNNSSPLNIKVMGKKYKTKKKIK
jgi:hypothetical protein